MLKHLPLNYLCYKSALGGQSRSRLEKVCQLGVEVKRQVGTAYTQKRLLLQLTRMDKHAKLKHFKIL